MAAASKKKSNSNKSKNTKSSKKVNVKNELNNNENQTSEIKETQKNSKKNSSTSSAQNKKTSSNGAKKKATTKSNSSKKVDEKPEVNSGEKEKTSSKSSKKTSTKKYGTTKKTQGKNPSKGKNSAKTPKKDEKEVKQENKVEVSENTEKKQNKENNAKSEVEEKQKELKKQEQVKIKEEKAKERAKKREEKEREKLKIKIEKAQQKEERAKEKAKKKEEKQNEQQIVNQKENENEKNEKNEKEPSKKSKEEYNKKQNNQSKPLDENEKPDYVKEMLKNKKKRMIIIISIVALILIILAFSTFFALFNMNNKTILKGVKIRNIEVSGLTIDETKQRLNEVINLELLPEIELTYGENYKITLLPEQIQYKYNIDEAVSNAYEVGRDGMIFENNYSLLFTAFFGKNLSVESEYNEELLNNFIEDVSSKIPGLVVEPSYYIEEESLVISKGKDGIQVKKDELKNKILEAIKNRNFEDISKENYNQTINIPVENVKASSIDIDKIYSEVHREPKDAYFETDPYKIYADVDGIDFNISIDEAKNIISLEDKEEYEIPLKISKAQKTINDIGTEAFPYLISKFSTKYDASNTNRSTNLLIAANKINGTVLMPGEVFSFNKVVGKRTVEEGYRDAKIYADGGVVDGLAGGICQISSTLYNVVLLANLEIVERRNHSFPTSYLEVGKDATVVYGAIDFQFKNSRNYPIKIEASVKNGIAEFKIFGMQEENEYEIRILTVTTQSIPYGTSYIDDPTLAPGRQVVVQAGHAGYKVTTSIEKRLNGTVVSKEVISNDTYNPMKTIIRRGPVAVPTEAAPVPVETPVQ